MPRINNLGYLERKNNKETPTRNWWLVKYGKRKEGIIPMKNIYAPKEYIGKKVRIKIELVDDI